MTNYRTRIQNFLRKLCKEGTYYAVSYKDGNAEPIIEGTTEKVSPTQVSCNEISSGFQADIRMGRRQALERASWVFQVRCSFAKEVDSENFEQFVMDKVPHIPADALHKDITIRIINAQYDHPPQQSPSNGSTIVFEFDAQVGRN